MSQPDPYRTLQVHPEADVEIIQVAYRKLAQRYHPDVATLPDAALRMAELNAARDLLLDPARREAYDQSLNVAGPASSNRPAHGPGSHRSPGGNPTGSPGRDPTGSPGGPTGSPGGAPHRTARSARPPAAEAGFGSSASAGSASTASNSAAGSTGSAAGSAGSTGSRPGNSSGSILSFGRYAGWSLGDIAAHDLEYVEWLDRMPIGRPYGAELDRILRQAGRRGTRETRDTPRGLFRRR